MENQEKEESPKPFDDMFIKELMRLREEAIPKIKIALVRPGAIFEKGNAFAAGYDVKAFNMTIEDGYVKFMLGIKSDLPDGWYAEVVHRSGNSGKDGILSNTKGTIDQDFRGEWQARIKIIQQPPIRRNRPMEAEGFFVDIDDNYVPSVLKLWEDGEKALQVLFHKIPEHKVVFVTEQELTDTERGEKGYGSTGNGLSQNPQ